MDFKNMNAKKVLVLTDKTLAQLSPMKVAIEALEREGIQYEVYDKCRVEPKDYSVKEAIAWGKARQADAFLAVGGGSVMDTAKIVNLYTAYPEADFLDFVSLPGRDNYEQLLRDGIGQRTPRQRTPNHQASEASNLRPHHLRHRQRNHRHRNLVNLPRPSPYPQLTNHPATSSTKKPKPA
jgi:hypothetical protein